MILTQQMSLADAAMMSCAYAKDTGVSDVTW